MKRLTIRNSDGTVSQPTKTTVEQVLYRLAAYENTGIEPEEITVLCEMDKRSQMAKMLRWEEAEQEGRLVVLPCKEDDEVYVLLIGRVIPFEITSVNLDSKCAPLFRAIHGFKLMYIFRPEDIGKTVFLTNERSFYDAMPRMRRQGAAGFSPKRIGFAGVYAPRYLRTLPQAAVLHDLYKQNKENRGEVTKYAVSTFYD